MKTISEIEDLLEEYNVSTYTDGKPAALGAYMSRISPDNLTRCIEENKDKISFDDWKEASIYWNEQSYLSPMFYLLSIWSYKIASRVYDVNCTYDIFFNDDTDSNSKGFAVSFDEAKEYIKQYNGTNESYFADYKGGTVSIVCNQTGRIAYQEDII